MMGSKILKYQKLSRNASAPFRPPAYKSFGFYLFSAEDVIIPAGGNKRIMTDIKITPPEGCFCFVQQGSGLESNHLIRVGAGVIDRDYRENVGVDMFNISANEYPVTKGDIIAEIICEQIFTSELQECDSKVLKFKRTSGNAIVPSRGSAYATGFDVYSAENCIVHANDNQQVMTDIQIALPEGCYCRVAPRSGLELPDLIEVYCRVIDEDYYEDIGIDIFNYSEQEFPVSQGDRIAALTCEKIFSPELQECDSSDIMMVASKELLKYQKLSIHATTPTRGFDVTAGYDISSAENCIVPARRMKVIMTDIKIAPPEGCFCIVAPRSGLELNNFIDVSARVIDQGYCENVGVEQEFPVSQGDIIAQLICREVFTPELQECHPWDNMIFASKTLKSKKLSDDATAPSRESLVAAGFDLRSAEHCIIRAGRRKEVMTDIQVDLPEGCHGIVQQKIGLALNNFIDVCTGVIYEDYRENVGVVMYNFSEQDFPVTKGDIIAEITCRGKFTPELEECDSLDIT